MENVQLSVSDFVALINQSLDYAYPSVAVMGEVAEYKISQGKWVSFKLKDDNAVVNCFMGIYQQRLPISDGMKVLIVGSPKLNTKGYFNLTIRTIKPVGEGSIKKSFDLLKAKLEAEGLFAANRKRPLPLIPHRVALITSTESAAYADFCKILNQRWGGLKLEVAHTQVQGEPAADQIIRAVHYINSLEELPEVLVIVRGGGSAEDLMTFNDEQLARTIAESRIPTLVGVGHEIDHTLADMVADVRASTPTNAAEILVPSRLEVISSTKSKVVSLGAQIERTVDTYISNINAQLKGAVNVVDLRLQSSADKLQALKLAVAQVNPQNVLRQGYALIRGSLIVGQVVEIETDKIYATTEVKNVRKK